jgi:hypothetical protein
VKYRTPLSPLKEAVFSLHFDSIMVTVITSEEQPEKKKLSTCLVQPDTFEFKHSTFEYSVYKPSLRFLRDFDNIFPSLSTKQRKQLLVVPIIQKCELDMVGLSKLVNNERDIKLELVCIRISKYWLLIHFGFALVC